MSFLNVIDKCRLITNPGTKVSHIFTDLTKIDLAQRNIELAL